MAYSVWPVSRRAASSYLHCATHGVSIRGASLATLSTGRAATVTSGIMDARIECLRSLFRGYCVLRRVRPTKTNAVRTCAVAHLYDTSGQAEPRATSCRARMHLHLFLLLFDNRCWGPCGCLWSSQGWWVAACKRIFRRGYWLVRARSCAAFDGVAKG